MKKITSLTAILVALLLPLSTYAVSPEELQAQLSQLLGQISGLQALVSPQQTVQTPIQTPAQPIVRAGSCPLLSRTLYFGISGSDVSDLQLYLANYSSIYPEGDVTGYFGRATERAVQRLQVKLGIISSGDAASTGYGVLGARTRAALLSSCGQPVAVAPISRSCPPIVTSYICPSGYVSIDGAPDASGCPTANRCTVNPTTCPQTTLQCPAGQRDQVGFNCSHTCVSNVVLGGSASLSNGTSISVTAPTYGQTIKQGTQLTISWNTQNAPTSSAISLWLTNANGVEYGLITGQQSANGSTSWVVPISRCSTNSGCVSSAGPLAYFTDPGIYKIVAKLYTPLQATFGGVGTSGVAPTYLGSMESGAFTILASSLSVVPPVITNVEAPTAALHVGQNGSWTVHATSPISSDQLHYSVVWGDEASGLMSSAPLQTSPSFIHSYTTAGDYTAVFTAFNSGGSVQSNSAVHVVAY